MEASICLANSCFLPSEIFFSVLSATEQSCFSKPLRSTYFFSPPSLINRLSVKHITFTPLLLLADCGDAETCWLVGKKMPFMWLCHANVLGVFNASVTLNLFLRSSNGFVSMGKLVP